MNKNVPTSTTGSTGTQGLSLLDITDAMNDVARAGKVQVGETSQGSKDKDSLKRLYSSIELNVQNRFYKQITEKPVKWCNPKNAWNISYFFIGEVYRTMKRNGFDRSMYMVLSDQYGFELDSVRMSLMIQGVVFIQRKRGFNLSKSGLPKQMLTKECKPFMNKFHEEMRNFQKSKKILQKLLYFPEQKPGKGVLNQHDQLVGCRDFTDKEVFDQQSGANSLRWFKTEDDFKKQGQKLFKGQKEQAWDQLLKKGQYGDQAQEEYLKQHRVSEKSCQAFVRYLALLGVLQKRVDRGIEISQQAEKRVFGNGYSVLRRQQIKVGWMRVIDGTFCPGIRCKTFQVRVCVQKDVDYTRDQLELNNIEMRYFKQDQWNRDRIQLQTDCGRYLSERVGIYEGEIKRKDYKKNQAKQAWASGDWNAWRNDKHSARKVELLTKLFHMQYSQASNFTSNFALLTNRVQTKPAPRINWEVNWNSDWQNQQRSSSRKYRKQSWQASDAS